MKCLLKCNRVADEANAKMLQLLESFLQNTLTLSQVPFV